MAVTKVTGDWEHQTVTKNVVVGSNQRPKIVLTTGCAFDVEFNDADDPAVRPLLALVANDGTTRVPQIWESHPYDSWLFVKSQNIEVVGPFHFRVMVNYDCELDASDANGTGQVPISPLMQPPEVSWSFAGSNVPIDTDTEGIPITNSAGESPGVPMTKDHSDMVLRYTRNELTFDKLVAADYKDAVNSDIFLGFGAGHVICTMFDPDEMRAATLKYYRVKYEFRIRYDEVKTRDANGDIQTRVFGWVQRVRDEGFREWVGSNPDGSPKYKEILDEKGMKISEPHLLDGSGKKLSDAAIQNPPLPEACFLKFDFSKKKTVLGTEYLGKYMTDSYVLSGEDHRRVQRSVRFTERYIGRDRLRRRSKGGGGGSNKIYARIIQTLQRADEEAGLAAIDHYEIELLDYTVEEWSSANGVTFLEDTIYKYVPDNKLYRCKITHTNPPALPPNTTPSHWEETSHEQAWIFGYSGDLLEAAPWLQPGDIVEVIIYSDPRWPDREWWILETVTRIQTGSGENIRCSLYWLQEEDGVEEKRLASVYR